jgi:hypothetical protein
MRYFEFNVRNPEYPRTIVGTILEPFLMFQIMSGSLIDRLAVDFVNGTVNTPLVP